MVKNRHNQKFLSSPMELPSPLSRYVPQNSKKTVFPGGSSKCREAEVVEISPPPTNRSVKSKSHKQKEVNFPEIIDLDLDDGCGDITAIDKKVVPLGKGKELMDNILSDPGDGKKKGSVDEALLPKDFTTGTVNVINIDDFGFNSFCGDDKYQDMYYDDVTFDEEYAILLQSQFDCVDMPTGIEAPIPWLSRHNANKMKSSSATTSNNSLSKTKLDNVGFLSGLDSSLTLWPVDSAQIMSTPGSSSVGQTQSSTWSYPKPARNLTGQSSFTYSNSQLKDPLNLPSVEKFPKSFRFDSPSHPEKKPFTGGATSYISSETKLSIGASYTPTSIKQQDNLLSVAATSVTDWQGMHNVVGHAVGNPWVPIGSNGPSHTIGFPKETAFNPLLDDPALAPSGAATSDISSLSSFTKVKCGNPDEIIERFQQFKNFDTVQDFSDHYNYQQNSSVKQPSKNWTKKIQEEWRILEKDLPDTIFVRVCELRMDILRAVIIGAEGTPYHDGLFFFDVFFPSNYPNVPPKVHYHSGGLRINPNLYNCGKVCLSLLNTWSGSQKEKWIPRTSTMLQVLVSIQGLILNTKPYFNEPGYASMRGSISGEKSSLDYNEKTFILSLRTMMYNIRRPPKHFEDFVAGHFCKCAHDILVACQAYTEGAQVGCLVKGGVQDVDEGDKSCSETFKHDVASFISTLVDAFKQVGAKDCDKFISLAQKANGVLTKKRKKANGVQASGPSPAYHHH